jgi:hypothetical protein
MIASRFTGLVALSAVTGGLVLAAPRAVAGPSSSPAAPSPTSPPPAPAAAATPSSIKEAGKHFTRGVTLFGEADYRAALVEFRRAYEIAPNAAVLYNLGQTYYQLQNYAAALTALERYLDESPPSATHRHEVEQTLDTLKTRVGRIAIKANVGDAEITVDDELVGKTPLDQPVLVSIGRRKITAMRAGRAPDTRFIDVAAGDTVKVDLRLTDADDHAIAAGDGAFHRESLITPGWLATGVLGAGAITTGTLAYLSSRTLETDRTTFPTSRTALDHQSSKVVTLSAVADVLAAAALITGGITLTLKWTATTQQEVRVAVTPNSVVLSGLLP